MPSNARTYTVSNGDWRCRRCGGANGALCDPFTGEWSAHLPDACQTPGRCMTEVIQLAEATREHARAGARCES